KHRRRVEWLLDELHRDLVTAASVSSGALTRQARAAVEELRTVPDRSVEEIGKLRGAGEQLLQGVVHDGVTSWQEECGARVTDRLQQIVADEQHHLDQRLTEAGRSLTSVVASAYHDLGHRLTNALDAANTATGRPPAETISQQRTLLSRQRVLADIADGARSSLAQRPAARQLADPEADRRPYRDEVCDTGDLLRAGPRHRRPRRPSRRVRRPGPL
ncbi:MAG: hypothetical protein Q4P32_00135, partial [Micrococcales bacterium]|nr:hypothetical protein [Micrococcales bacterium]